MIVRLYEYDIDKEGFDVVGDYNTGPYEELTFNFVLQCSNRVLRIEMLKSESWDTDDDEERFYAFKSKVDRHNFDVIANHSKRRHCEFD